MYRAHHDLIRITEKYAVYNPNTRPNRRHCLQQSRNFSHGGLLRRSDSDHPAGMRAEKAELRCILERLSNQPVQPSAPAGAGHPTRRQTAGKEAAPGRYPHRTGDFIRHCIKIHRLQVRACNRCFCVHESLLRKNYTENRSAELSIPPAGIRSPKKLWFLVSGGCFNRLHKCENLFLYNFISDCGLTFLVHIMYTIISGAQKVR